VKELRERTGAGMMECKKALVEAGGDIEQAAEAMRISGQAKADKKASRVAAEGIIEAYAADGRAVLVEINSETDFVAREDSFKAFAKDVAKAAHAANAKTVEEASAAKLSSGETVEEARKAMVARIGENIVVRRALTTEGANLGAYVHAGRIGVVAALEGGDEELAKDIAMHVTAANPQYVKPEDVPADVVEKEKNIQVEIAMQSGKPKDIAEKMVAGRMKKFTGEVSLTGQPFVRDPSTQVEKVLKDKNAEVTNFIRLDVGEGIETAAFLVNPSRVGWEQLSSQNSHPLTVCYAGDANISAKVVKELRERTGAGMMECKKALVEAGGDIEQAAEAMRISGQAKADKKASRVAAEGIIEAYAADGRAVLVEINSETDFVAREDSFKAFAKDVAKAAHAANAKTVEEASAAKLSSGETVEEARKAMVARIGENIVVRRALTTEGANLGAYVHAGRIGVVAALEGGDEELAKDIAMHVTAANPQYVKPEDVPADVVEKEKNIQVEIAMQSGKPKDIAEKMVAGRMKKFTGEVSLTGQPFVRDPSTQVEKVLKDKNATVTNFIRLDVGEGVETAP